MLILSQKGNVMVNMDSLQAITTYIFRNYVKNFSNLSFIILPS